MFSSGSLTTLPGSFDSFKTTSVFPVRFFNFHQTTEIISLATDAHDGVLYLMDGNSRSLYKMENFNVWLNDTSQSISLVHEGISKTSCKLAFDWLTKNIYWTDEFYNWIAVQSTTSEDRSMFKILIENGLTKPLAIAVDPVEGYMFWSDHTKTSGKIERASLAGQDRTVIVTGTAWVPDMTVDTASKNIFWIDIQRHTVESCDYFGNNRRVIRRSKFPTISMSGIAIYKGLVCVTEYHSYLVTCLDKNTGDNLWMRYFRAKTPWAISVFDKKTQKLIDHGCGTLQCEHMCANTPSGAKCICKSGFKLAGNQKDCEADNHLYPKGLFISNETSICMLDIRVITSLSHAPKCIKTGLGSVRHLAVATDEYHAVFYIDDLDHELVMLDIITNVTTKLAKVGNVTGIVYDWVDKNVYWSESDSNSIKVISLVSSAANVLYKGQAAPSHLSICPYHSKLFWISGNQGSRRIVSGTFDGKTLETLVSAVNLTNPTGLYYSPTSHRLYWISAGVIHSSKIDGSDMKMHFPVHSDTELFVYKDYAISSRGGRELHSSFLGAKRVDLAVELDGFGSITGFSIYDPILQKKTKGPCDVSNGGCEHICVPHGQKKFCMCGFGYLLDKEGLNCSSISFTNDFLLAADFTHKRIYQIKTDSVQVTAVDVQDNFFPTRAIVHQRSKEIFWSDYATRQIRRVTIQGREPTVIYRGGVFTTFGMAIDYSTGLLYFTASVSGPNATSYIGVVDPYSGKYKHVIKDLSAAYEVALHPDKGIMFWTDNGNSPYIGSASMDGTKQVVLVESIRQASGMTIDYKDNRIYWTDGVQDVVEYCDFNGEGRVKLFEDDQSHLSNLVVSGDVLYYTAINRQKITKVNKNTGVEINWMDDSFEFGRLESVDIFPKTEQPINLRCAENNGGCSTFCLAIPNGYKCACEDGISLLSDGKTCYGEGRDVLGKDPGTLQSGALNDRKDASTALIGPIVGGIVAAILVIVAVLVTIFFYLRKRRQPPYSEQIDTPNIHFANDQGVTNPACVDIKNSPT
ncbi:hypothetical protein FSP39_001901 [Pinctada imbricata]|uniref:EGF-like domain-containing protein n=1 Tax=Pinctada imbricata TaxID=66713 RepID=A0AA89BLL9_PINIB|nr:hypothetical protein FSP39_001901 [Pinctada imbricata]